LWTFWEFEAGGRRPERGVYARRSGLPICWNSQSGLAIQSESDLDGHSGLDGAALQSMCSTAYFNSSGRALTKEERAFWAETSVLVKYRLREQIAECFYIQRCKLNEVWDFGEPCSQPDFEVYFTQVDSPYKRIEELAEGQLYRIAVEFGYAPDDESAPVTLTNPRSGATISVVARPTDDDRIFRTPPLTVLEEVEP